MADSAQLRSKLFSFGLYGRPTTALDSVELAAALHAPYAEIVPESAADSLRTAFTLGPLGCGAAQDAAAPGHVVRMCTMAWREYIFRPGVNIVSKEYFYLIDFLLEKQAYMSAAEIRSALGIEPKTYHYICKKLKELGVICERREGSLACIRLCEIADRALDAKATSFEEELFRHSGDLDLRRLTLFANLPFHDQIQLAIRNSADGMDAKSLYQSTGLRPKTGLKMMQRLAAQRSSDFCMVTELCYKSSTCKIYSRSAYEQVTRARMARIASQGAVGELDTISAEEKAAAMRFLAEKHGSFVLGKDIVKQLSEITGWAYTFDRKTLLSAARGAGLHIAKSEIGSSRRYRISLAPPEQVSEGQAEANLRTGHAEKFKRRLKSLLLIHSSQVKLDNGAAANTWSAYKELLDYLCACLDKAPAARILFSDAVSGMPARLFFSLSSFTKPCLRYNAALSKWRNSPERLGDAYSDPGRSRSIFYIENCMELVRSAVLDLAVRADALPLDEYLSLLSDRYAVSIKAKLESKSIRTALNKLKKEGFIEISNCDKCLYIRRGALGAEDPKIHALIAGAQTKHHVDYNTRERANRKACHLDPGLPDAEIKAFIYNNFPGDTADALCAVFAAPAAPSTEPRAPARVTVLPADLQDLYLGIKRALVNEHMDGFKLFADRANSEVETVLRYLMHRKIINGLYIPKNAAAIPLNQKFARMFAKHPSFYKEFTHVEDDHYRIYFYRVYKLVHASGSVDTNAILERLTFIEDFELMRFFEVYSGVFHLQNADGFTSVSLRCAKDPFQDD